MIDTLAGICLILFISILALTCLATLLEDTETFKAIDEKIARFLKGDDEYE